MLTSFIVSGALGLGIAVLVAATLLQRSGTAEALWDARSATEVVGHGVLEPLLDTALLQGDPAALARLDAVVRDRLLSGPIVRVKVWTPEGRVVYSDQPGLIGQVFPLRPGALEALSGESRAEVSEVTAPENLYERDQGNLFEVYVGLHSPDGQPLLFEAYLDASTIGSGQRRIMRSLLPALLVGLIALEAVQIPLAWSLGRRLWQSQERQLALMRSEVDTTAALSHAYAQLEALFDTVPVVLTVYDRDLRIVRINTRATEWMSTESSAMVGRHISEAFPLRWPAVREVYERALRGETFTRQVDRRALGESSGPAQMAITYAPVRQEGAVAGVIVAAVDITDQVTHEQELAAALTFREDVIHFASHELRTPLTSIMGFTQAWERAIASGRPLSESYPSDLALVRSESERMARTLDLILDLVSLDAGLTAFGDEPVAIAPLVRGQARMLRERHPGARLHEDLLADPIIESDADRIIQVVANLLENAAKYAGPTATIVVRVRVEDAPAPAAVIEVEDDGPGIPEEQHAAIFERRYRGHTGGAAGLGLGLYISRMIATRLGGSLTVASTRGKGATFTMRVPFTR